MKNGANISFEGLKNLLTMKNCSEEVIAKKILTKKIRAKNLVLAFDSSFSFDLNQETIFERIQ